MIHIPPHIYKSTVGCADCDVEMYQAIGLDIPCMENRKNGCGTKAFQMYMDYLKEHGHKSFYAQTWSGNLAMVRVAEKLGFKEVCRKEKYREVNGRMYDAITWRLDL